MNETSALLGRIIELEESLSDLTRLQAEDIGWTKLTTGVENDLDPKRRKQMTDLCEVMTIANPLIKRGFLLRQGYVWGAGHTIAVTSGEADKDGEVNAVVQAMLDDPRNASSLRTQEAQEGMERWLYTHGDVAFLLHADEYGKLVVRQEDPDHITDVITDPEDATAAWYWCREFTTRILDAATGKTDSKKITVWHPDVDYRPAPGDRLDFIGGKQVRWDQRILMRSVNIPATGGRSRGIPDCYAALPWARMSKEFLEAWFLLAQALSRYAWRTSTRGRAAAAAARAARTTAATDINPSGAGAHVFTDPDTTLEAIPKTGATIDARSAQPIQQFVAAALDIPLTMLLADPGTTGARSVAETLDQPLENSMAARRRLWGEVLARIAGHAIDLAVEHGTLPGVVDATGPGAVALPEGWSRTVLVTWPDYDSVPVETKLRALRDADGMDKLPPLLLARLILDALGVEDADEWMERITDGDGNFIPPEKLLSAADREAQRQGEM